MGAAVQRNGMSVLSSRSQTELNPVLGTDVNRHSAAFSAQPRLSLPVFSALHLEHSGSALLLRKRLDVKIKWCVCMVPIFL